MSEDRKITIELDELEFATLIRLLNNAEDADHQQMLNMLGTTLEESLQDDYDANEPLEAGDTVELVIRIDGYDDIPICVEMDGFE